MIKDKSIFIRNIYWMLAYAFQTLKPDSYETIAKTEFDNIHNMFASILATGIGKQLKQGLYREYVEHREDMLTVRGKIDMPGTMQNHIAHKQQIACKYDILSENNLLNQIVKTTSLLLLRHDGVDEEYKITLKRELMFFSGVDAIELKTIRWTTIRFKKQNSAYRMIISICQLIVEGMLMTTEQGEYRLARFIDEQAMSRLYEKFILEFFKKECPEVKAGATQIQWAVDGDRTYLPIMQTDIMLSKDDNILIIDAKYYEEIMQSKHGSRTLNSSHLYQIYAYVKNKVAQHPKNTVKVTGMLLYAKTDEPIDLNEEYHMDGNVIRIKTLDLNRDFSEIAQQLKKIVEEQFFTKTSM